MNFSDLCSYVKGKRMVVIAQLLSEKEPRGPLYPEKAEIIDLPLNKGKIISFPNAGAATSVFEHPNNCILIQESKIRSIDKFDDSIHVLTDSAIYIIKNM